LRAFGASLVLLELRDCFVQLAKGLLTSNRAAASVTGALMWAS
jgi:hypothetical protein